jgi:hypothetical protein
LRTDAFFNKKSVHVKLTKEVHTLLREKLFRHGITMQDLFQEAAEMAVHEGVRSEKFLEKIARKKLIASLEKPSKSQNSSNSEIDSEIMYNLLEEHSNDDEQSKERRTDKFSHFNFEEE